MRARRGRSTELLSNGANPNAQQKDGDSILHGAVQRLNVEMVRLVLRKGGHADAQNGDKETPLQLARRLGWKDGVALLENHAAVVRSHRSSRLAYDVDGNPITFEELKDVSRQDQSAVTANSHGNIDAVEKLLNDDPRKVFSISSDAELAIEACAHTGNRPIIQLHLGYGSPYSLPTAVVNGDLEFSRFLLDDDPLRVNERGAHDYAVMWYTAIGGDQVDLAELLIEKGVPVDQGSLGTTALHWCANRNRPELAHYLIEAGADVHALGYTLTAAGETPLQTARRRGHTKLAKILQDGGAKG